jgi:single-strand DNA-binding protein
MSARTKGRPEPVAVDDPASESGVNEIRLVGRLSHAPSELVLPSGDTIWTFRLVVPRTGGPPRSRQTVDSIECTVWSGRVRRSVPGWRQDDVVEVVGALRRRFFRAAGAPASRVEVEVAGGRVIRRAASA